MLGTSNSPKETNGDSLCGSKCWANYNGSEPVTEVKTASGLFRSMAALLSLTRWVEVSAGEGAAVGGLE